MKLKLYTISLFAALLALSSCKTAKKMYEKGNYDEAVELAAKKLQKDPDDPKFRDIIMSSYRFARNDHESRISEYNFSSNELKWEWIYNEYASLQKMYEAIYKVPAIFDMVQPVNYTSYLITYAEKAGQVRYNRGIAFMQRYDKQSYRQAYQEFKTAIRYIPGHRDAMQKMDEAYAYAVTNVIVLPMQQHGGFVYTGYAPGNQNLDDRLLQNLQLNSGNEFVQFYSAWDARSRNIRVDLELDMEPARINLGRYDDQRSLRKVSKEIVVKERIIKPDSVVREYATVTATITHTRRTLRSDAMMRIVVRDAAGYSTWTELANSNHSWSTEFSTFAGDERALSEADKQQINRRKEFAPTDNEILRCLLEDLGNDAQWKVRNYFSRL